MERLRFSSPGMLLIVAITCAATICLLDVSFFRPYVAREREFALQEQAAKAETTTRWALRSEQKRLSALCRTLADSGDLAEHLRDGSSPQALARRLSALGVDAAWLCSQDGTVTQLPRGAEHAMPAESPAETGLVELGSRTALFARCNGSDRARTAGTPEWVCLVRFLDEALLAEIGPAVPAELIWVAGDHLPDGTPEDEPDRQTWWLPQPGHMAVAWPGRNADGKMLGYFRANLSVVNIHSHAAAVRRITLITLSLAGGAVLLVILGANILLASPITRLLKRVHRVEIGEYPTEAELTRHLHAEPLALAKRLQKAFTAITHMSKTDSLTGLANRRRFEEALHRAYVEARRYHRPLSVMVLDVDLFKAVNDTAGHKAGDDLLKLVAGVIEKCCRNADLPARLGGDEFAVLLPETAAPGASVVAERIRKSLGGRNARINGSEVNITLSIGVSDFNSGRIDAPHDILVLADRALYAAKQGGRDRVIQAHELEDAVSVQGDKETDRVDRLRDKLAGLDTQFKALFVRALQEIVQALERRDPHMADHARKVGHYCVLIARQLNLPDQFARQIELSALLHDIGMLALPDSIALCAGRLNEQQLEAMRRHPLIGARILEGMEFLEMVTPQVRSHHERFDGKGYPDGLAGQSIPLAARIVAVADVFDAMTSRRAFRGAKSVTESLIELESEAGKQLDPNVVTAFLAEACRLGDKLTDVPLPKAEDEDEAEAPAEDAAEAHARSGAAAAG